MATTRQLLDALAGVLNARGSLAVVHEERSLRFGVSLTARNQPQNHPFEVETAQSPDLSPNVDAGPMLFVPALTIGASPIPHVRLNLAVFQPIDDPSSAIRYGPIVGLTLSLSPPPAPTPTQ